MDYYPNATVAEYGIITVKDSNKEEMVMRIKKEIKARVSIFVVVKFEISVNSSHFESDFWYYI